MLLLLALGIPLALLISPAFRRAAEKILPLPLLGTAPLFLLNQLMSGWARDSYKPFYRYKIIRFPQALQEVKEANFELLCLCLAIIALIELTRRLKNRSLISGTEPPAG